ncbi:hypothetical protein TBKG_01719 [Mycobacterium tuberculosis '98-R604 INH-RIF-EM']|nr:hypothetical protein TBKG_01719 [Mycobacterium tuberculosis '98-R604 INH-RIF-EM']
MSRIDRVLEAARRRYRRLAADQVPRGGAARRGARRHPGPKPQRAREGEVPGALSDRAQRLGMALRSHQRRPAAPGPSTTTSSG